MPLKIQIVMQKSQHKEKKLLNYNFIGIHQQKVKKLPILQSKCIRAVVFASYTGVNNTIKSTVGFTCKDFEITNPGTMQGIILM